MDCLRYKEIVDYYLSLRKIADITKMQLILKNLIAKFCNETYSISEETIYSIISFEYQQEIKRKRSVNWTSLFERWKAGETLLALSAERDLSPAILANKTLTYVLSKDSNAQLKQCFNDSVHIRNDRLAFEVMLCRYVDPFKGSHSLHISNIVGTNLERRIEKYLRENGIDFYSENDLRELQYDVTPDFKLKIPMALKTNGDFSQFSLVKCDVSGLKCKECGLNYNVDCSKEDIVENSDRNNIVNWIECKSLFASIDCHKEYCKKQLNSYYDRFGKGVVIYAYGCVDKILKENSKFVVLQNVNF